MIEDLESTVAIQNKRRLSKNIRKQPDYCPFDLPGVTKLKLTPIAQKHIGCVVGDHVSAESPWTLVKKETLEENIEHNGEHSEFFLLKEKIQEYGENKIYFGWVPVVSETEDFFYIVYTLEAKEKVERIIQRQKAELQRRVDKLIFRPVGHWKSLGSETEVYENLIQSYRPLCEVQLKTKFPLRDTKVSFSLKRVESIKDGYVELLPDERFKPELIHRRRVDVGIQAIANKISTDVQTTSTYPNHIWTQYKYEYTPPKLEDDEQEEEQQDKRKQQKIKKIYPVFNTKYMISTVEELGEDIKVNNFFNIYQDDYASLATKKIVRVNSLHKMSTLVSFSDQQLCGSKLVSSCAWDPYRSGILAVSYSDTPLNLLKDQKIITDKVFDITFGYCPVLIWSYTDTIFPKLFLATPRPITCLSYCPYEKNILVGGCANGQIIIWNLEQKLEEKECVEILTTNQQKSRMNLLDILNWNNEIYYKVLIQPIIITSLKNAHKDLITAINWMPTNVEISSNGKLSYDCLKSRQFFSCSLDGTISVWNIDSRERKLSVKKSKNNKKKLMEKVGRLKTLPVELNFSDSKVVKLGQPIFTFKLSAKDAFPICAMLKLYDELKYKSIGSSFNNLPGKRTEFELEENQHKMENLDFLFASSIGKVVKVELVPNEDLDMENQDVQNLNQKIYSPIHDGIITTCQPHPIFRENFITIGGTVFAIWNMKLLNPILWMRAPHGNKYISGGWAEKNPSLLILVRSDSSCELWDLLNFKISPIKVISLGKIISLFGTTNLGHCRKGTMAISDNLGAITVLIMPEVLSLYEEERIIQTKNYFDRAIGGRKLVNSWIDNFQKSIKKQPEKKNNFKNRVIQSGRISRSASTRITQIERMDRVFAGVEWKTLQEERIFNAMLELKNLNISELEKFKDPIQQKELEKRERKLKITLMLQKKHKIIKNSEAEVLPNIEFGKERKYSLSPIQSEEDDSYIEGYEEIEERALNYNVCNKYVSEFSFTQMIAKARAQRHKNVPLLRSRNVKQ